jgi:hypothetical protein
VFFHLVTDLLIHVFLSLKQWALFLINSDGKNQPDPNGMFVVAKVKLFLCLIKHCIMKTYGEVEV